MLDRSNMLELIENFPSQCLEAFDIPKDKKLSKKVKNIVFCGMGGSAIGGNLAGLFLDIQYKVNRDYHIPKYVNKDSAVFIISYSGNTEETLSCFEEAKKKKAEIISITSGGKLSKKDKKAVIIPKDIPPRAALAYLFITLLKILQNSGLIKKQDDALKEIKKVLNKNKNKNKGLDIAKSLRKKIPLIYSENSLKPVAYRFKTQINENSKQPAYFNVFPELNHNEVCGFKRLSKKTAAVILRDKKESKKIRARIDLTKNILKKNTEIFEIKADGSYLLSKILNLINICDYASYYLALINKEDPAPVEIIEKFKKKLKQRS